MKAPFFFLAAIGWILGLAVHLTALIGKYDLSSDVPGIWSLHIGIFIVWAPTVLILIQNRRIRKGKTLLNPIAFFREIARGTPIWLWMLGGASYLYAMANFFFFMGTKNGSPDIRDGKYVLHSRGALIKTLTREEYEHHRAHELRGFSGHWMAFYGIAALILFPYRKEESDEQKNTQPDSSSLPSA